MAFKGVAIITLLSMLTACREEQRSLSIIHAASSSMEPTSQKRSTSDTPGSLQEPRIDMPRITDEIYENAPPQYCYSFILKRPREQRASAVQARLEDRQERHIGIRVGADRAHLNPGAAFVADWDADH